MSHNITSSDRMIFVGDKPWHDLGVNVGNVTSIKEALKLAGLDWEVDLVRTSVRNPYLQSYEGLDSAYQDLDSWAVVRKSDGRVLSPHVGRVFRPVQNEDAFDRVLGPILKAGLATIETAGSLRGGGRVWMLLKLKSPDAVIVSSADDRVAKYLFVAIGHDGSMSIRPGFTAIRIVCDNTLSAAIDGPSVLRIRHTKSAPEALTAAADAIARADANFERAAEVFRALSRRNVTEAQIRAFVDKVFPPAKKEAETTPAPEVQAAMDEWNDGPTDADVRAPSFEESPIAQVDFAALLAKPVASLAKPADKPKGRRVADNIIEIFETGGRRGDLAVTGIRGTGWAAYNAMTEYQTWVRGADAENRMTTLYFQESGLAADTLQAAAETFLV